MAFDKILIANRGEIAVRVMATAQRLGYRTVAVYSAADSKARHVAFADEAVALDGISVTDTYLNIEAIIAAARLTQADAIHPGYGFLSENADFAAACAAAGITFIGPPIDAIRLMGSKRLSKIAMIDAGVPCIPGYEGEDQSDAQLIAQAQQIGTPLMIKASAGGGGRGMRLVTNLNDLAAQLSSARSEAQNAFGSGELILEKAVMQPRHVEIQVFGDQHGNVLYLGERDCSVQRRHQKVVEEAPSPAVGPDLRSSMGAAAVKAAQSVNYVGAGTVEFLLDASGEFYFLEMNTRLQVEHPVTELVTGLDLVEWQIKVAQGWPLPCQQSDIQLQGHAIEVRLYAEDPAQSFMPQTGLIQAWQFPAREGLRVDHGIQVDSPVTAFYDPMLAKLIAWGETRDDAIRRLLRLLEDSCLYGVTTNKYFLRNLIRHPLFRAGEATTAFIAEHFQDDDSMQRRPVPPVVLAAATLARLGGRAVTQAIQRRHFAVWLHQDEHHAVHLDCQSCLSAGSVVEGTFHQADTGVAVALLAVSPSEITLRIDGVRQRLRWLDAGHTVFVSHQGQDWELQDATHAEAESSLKAGSGSIAAPMDGAIVALSCDTGQAVTKGATLAIMEAMKMEHPLKADKDGVIDQVFIKPGDQVKGRQVLITIADA